MTTTPEQQDDAPIYYTGLVANGPDKGKMQACVRASYAVAITTPISLSYVEKGAQARPDYYQLRYEWHPLEGAWRLDIPSQWVWMEYMEQVLGRGRI